MTRISRDAYGLRLAEAAASRADCTRRQVGAVIVAENGSVVSTGYNGRASGLPGCLTDGACPRGQMAYPSEPPCKVGDDGYADPTGPWCEAEGLREEGFVCTLQAGHDGGWHVAHGVGIVLEVWPTKETQPASVGYEATGCDAAHAEVNAIIRAGRDRCLGSTIYITDEPCHGCSVVIAAAGLARVVTPPTPEEIRDSLIVAEDENGVHYAEPTPINAVQAVTSTGDVVRRLGDEWVAPEVWDAAHLSESPSYLEAPSFPAVPPRRTPSDAAPDLDRLVPMAQAAQAREPLKADGLAPDVMAALQRSVNRAMERQAEARRMAGL